MWGAAFRLTRPLQATCVADHKAEIWILITPGKPLPQVGEATEGKAAFRCETIIARFPHPEGEGYVRSSGAVASL
jgi:hypothetical protein